MKKWNYRNIKEFVDSKSKSILLTPETEGIHSHSILKFRCVCGEEYEKPFAKFKAHNSTFLCYDCGQKIKTQKSAKTQTLSQEDFEKTVREKTEGTISVLGEYNGAQKRVLVKCNLCGKEWSPFATSILSGCRCECNISICAEKRRMNKDEFLKRLHEINPDIELIGEFKTTLEPVKVKCLKCEFEWERTAGNFIYQKSFCPICHEYECENRLTDEEFKIKIKRISPNIDLLTEYKTYHEKVQCKCQDCGNIWWAKPGNLIQGSNCKPCGYLNAGGKKRKTDAQFRKEVFDLVNDEYEILGKYTRKFDKVLIKHNKCGHQFNITPNSFLSGNRCPKCKQSRGEKLIEEFLIKNKIKFQIQKRFNDCRDINTLPFDFYLPDTNICIEYDGQQHFRPLGFGSKNNEKILNGFINTLIHDNIKNKFCEKNKIELIRIPYWEKDNISNILTKKSLH